MLLPNPRPCGCSQLLKQSYPEPLAEGTFQHYAKRLRRILHVSVVQAVPPQVPRSISLYAIDQFNAMLSIMVTCIQSSEHITFRFERKIFQTDSGKTA